MNDRKFKVAAIQMSCSDNIEKNLEKAEKLVRKAAKEGAKIILLQELFETLYFCQEEDCRHYELAFEIENNRAVKRFKNLASELKTVLPISFFEKKNNARFNSVAVIDADGSVLGIYRKTHIPDGPGYEEKFYFNPGDTGFKVFNTQYAKIGVGICWDQWFPETARCMALMGAEILLYPTAIGSEPNEENVDSKRHWQICMQGHAAANILPVVASNRIGVERFGKSELNFYGTSFITNHKGEILKEADNSSEGVIIEEFDFDEIRKYRDYWGVFRDRRPCMYSQILTNDGENKTLVKFVEG